MMVPKGGNTLKYLLIPLLLINLLILTLSCTSNSSTPNSPYHIQSHTGYVKSTATYQDLGTGESRTGIVFQDGFAVQFIGRLNPSLMPAVGQKIKLTYRYDPQVGGNVFESLLDVR